MGAYDGMPLNFAMDPLRKLVRPDEENKSMTRHPNKDVFWNELVGDVKDVWSKIDVRLSTPSLSQIFRVTKV